MGGRGEVMELVGVVLGWSCEKGNSRYVEQRRW